MVNLVKLDTSELDDYRKVQYFTFGVFYYILCRMRVLKKINKFRSENGDLQPVNVSKELDQNAQEWADKIVINDHFKDRFI